MPDCPAAPLSRRAALHLGAAGFAAAVAAPAAGQAAGVPDLLIRWAEGWSTLGDPQMLLGLVAENVIYEDVAVGDVVRGAEAFRGLLAEAEKAIPDFRVELFDGFATDTMAAAEYALAGTQTGDLPYLPASGKAFRLRAASVLVLDGGKIRRESRYYDMAQFLSQLGALPPNALPKLGAPAATPGGS